uniref:Uncharacterized protein n=1 Tax=Dermatophagoides pteronyssinus TaxID=6956 RepID=A0A6P6YMJ6_DERPT|nr:putative uncharacterized protein DDB_G0282129 [Dermatophagoides pteronyssinus]
MKQSKNRHHPYLLSSSTSSTSSSSTTTTSITSIKNDCHCNTKPNIILPTLTEWTARFRIDEQYMNTILKPVTKALKFSTEKFYPDGNMMITLRRNINRHDNNSITSLPSSSTLSQSPPLSSPLSRSPILAKESSKQLEQDNHESIKQQQQQQSLDRPFGHGTITIIDDGDIRATHKSWIEKPLPLSSISSSMESDQKSINSENFFPINVDDGGNDNTGDDKINPDETIEKKQSPVVENFPNTNEYDGDDGNTTTDENDQKPIILDLNSFTNPAQSSSSFESSTAVAASTESSEPLPIVPEQFSQILQMINNSMNDDGDDDDDKNITMAAATATTNESIKPIIDDESIQPEFQQQQQPEMHQQQQTQQTNQFYQLDESLIDRLLATDWPIYFDDDNNQQQPQQQQYPLNVTNQQYSAIANINHHQQHQQYYHHDHRNHDYYPIDINNNNNHNQMNLNCYGGNYADNDDSGVGVNYDEYNHLFE